MKSILSTVAVLCLAFSGVSAMAEEGGCCGGGACGKKGDDACPAGQVCKCEDCKKTCGENCKCGKKEQAKKDAAPAQK